MTRMRGPANDEMVQGFRDGYDPNSPEPSENRSHSYRHGFMVGRGDILNNPEKTADELRKLAEEAMTKDETA